MKEGGKEVVPPVTLKHCSNFYYEGRLVGRKSRTYFSSNLCLFEPSFGRSISHIISRMWANLALGRKRGKYFIIFIKSTFERIMNEGSGTS